MNNFISKWSPIFFLLICFVTMPLAASESKSHPPEDEKSENSSLMVLSTADANEAKEKALSQTAEAKNKRLQESRSEKATNLTVTQNENASKKSESREMKAQPALSKKDKKIKKTKLPKGSRASSNLDFFAETFTTVPSYSYFSNLNFGLGIVYFSGIRGTSSRINNSERLKTKRMQSNFVRNRSILTEAVAGWNLGNSWSFLNFLGVGFGVLSQNNIYIQSYIMTREETGRPSFGIFQGTVNLQAIVSKFFLTSPYSFLLNKIISTPFMVLSVGPSWQTWSDLLLYNVSSDNVEKTTRFRQKISSNCFFGTDLGFKVQSINPQIKFALLLGCKFNLWGQAKSMGKADNQKWRSANGNNPQYALNQPYSVKTVYQWAPYIGFDWLF